MICNKCGHHSEIAYGVCPCCGQRIKNKKGRLKRKTKTRIITMAVCFGAALVTVVGFLVV
jgi:uncharacterized membrane protein YvbJ